MQSTLTPRWGGYEMAWCARGPGALATVVGVLVEVPVMLSVCGVFNRTKGWFPSLTMTEEES